MLKDFSHSVSLIVECSGKVDLCSCIELGKVIVKLEPRGRGPTRRGLPSARWVRKEASVGVVSDLAGSALIIKWTVDKVKPRR